MRRTILEHLNRLIGDNLKRIRAEKSLSLDSVAKMSGVSKSMLGQIERGEVNPTISTVWKIANGLKVSFSAIVSRPQQEFEVVLGGEIEPLLESDGGFRNFPLFPFDAERGFEMFSVEVDPGVFLKADPHGPGTEEFITVTEGRLDLIVGEDEHALLAGDAIRFRSDTPHSYRNPAEAVLRLVMVIHYPR